MKGLAFADSRREAFFAVAEYVAVIRIVAEIRKGQRWYGRGSKVAGLRTGRSAPMLCRLAFLLAEQQAWPLRESPPPYFLRTACLAAGFRFLYRYCSLVRALSLIVFRGSLHIGTSSPYHWNVGMASLDVDVKGFVSRSGGQPGIVPCRFRRMA